MGNALRIRLRCPDCGRGGREALLELSEEGYLRCQGGHAFHHEEEIILLRARDARERLAQEGHEHSGSGYGQAPTFRAAIRTRRWGVVGDYFFYRFSDPTAVAAFAALSVLAKLSGPALDLCCGAGHMSFLMRSLGYRGHLIGVDSDLRLLRLARRYVVPDQELIWWNASEGLPFEDGVFGAVVCADALHYVANKARALADVLRVLRPGGLVVLAHVHNAGCHHYTPGEPVAVEDCARLLRGSDLGFLRERELVGAAVNGASAPLRAAKEVEGDPSYSVIVSRAGFPFEEVGPVPPPGARGELRINPLYRTSNVGLGTAGIFVWPSRRYAKEFSCAREYLPRLVWLPADWRTAPTESLLRRRVLLWLPDRYL